MLLLVVLSLLVSFLKSERQSGSYDYKNSKRYHDEILKNWVWVYPCDAAPGNTYQFCNTSLTFEERTANYVSLLSVNDMQITSSEWSEPLPDLGISVFQWWNGAAHGIVSSPGVSYSKGPIYNSTMFPQVITTGSTFNKSLFYMIGKTISSEGRAMYNYKQAGLTYWDPNINIFRDPRWGRGQETPGEDPYLTSEYTVNWVKGFQGDNEKYLKASACIKHFAGYSVEDSDGYTRHTFNAIISDYDLNDTYLPAFKNGIVYGNASSIMCSYNEVNGVPSCANKYILTDLAREKWGFYGYITSDCSAVSDVLNNHHYTTDPGETCAAVYKAGMDLNCGGFTQTYVNYSVNVTGELAISDLQTAFTHLVMTQMRLGLFDDPSLSPWYDLGPKDVANETNLKLSLDATRQGMVLLKNNGILPLKTSDYKTVAMIGPNANNPVAIKGNYYGIPPFWLTPLDGLEMYYSSDNILFAAGCTVDDNSTANFTYALNATIHADLTILVMGIDLTIEGEANDRTLITLPGVQNQLIEQTIAVATGPVILVILSGGCIDISRWQNNELIQGILWGGIGGMYAGEAICDVLFGTFNPTGLLDQTWYYADYVNEVEMIDMNMRPNGTTNPGRGYRYYTGDVLYPFGYGLSYTTFSCNNLAYNKNNNTISIDITNTGNMVSGAVVTIYWVPNPNNKKHLIKRLIAFDRVDSLNTGQKVTLLMDMYKEFLISKEMNDGGNFVSGGACDNVK